MRQRDYLCDSEIYFSLVCCLLTNYVFEYVTYSRDYYTKFEYVYELEEILSWADPNAGDGLELQAIAAVVIGGTSLLGGRGSVVSSFFGVLIIAVLGAGLAGVGAQEPTKRLITGFVIVAAVVLDYYRHRIGGLRRYV